MKDKKGIESMGNLGTIILVSAIIIIGIIITVLVFNAINNQSGTLSSSLTP